MRALWHKTGRLAVIVAVLAPLGRAERINQEGRILGPEVAVTSPTLFNTAAADTVLSSLQIMPLNSAWNEDISSRPLRPNSAAMIAQIRADLASGRRTLRAFHEMNFVLVPDNQPLVPIAFLDYPEESDPSPYPIPANTPIETWPRETGALTLAQWQQDINNTGGDRHAIMAMPGAGFIWETWQMRLAGGQWQASNGARFNLRTNDLRPAGWTSADAAGLPMFPALVRYDECVRGMVEHAMRIVVRRTRREYIYPATHFASTTPASETNVPAMGQRVRLRADFPIPENWTIFEKAVARGLKKYGAFVADNGNFFSISVTPDDRYPAGAFDNLSTIDVSEFEVVQTTGPEEGPRSPGAPTANASGDFTAQVGVPSVLGGVVSSAGATVEWTKYSGPGTVAFTYPNQAVSTVTFSEPGDYTLMLTVRDGVHAPARDAVVVTVLPAASVATVSVHPPTIAATPGDTVILAATTSGEASRSYAWRRNGAVVAEDTPGMLALNAMEPKEAGLYTAVGSTIAAGEVESEPAIVGLSTTTRVTGSGEEIGPNIVHSNGRIYDQVLLQGGAVSLRADASQVLRVSFLDLSDDIVQVEFTGAGTVTLVLDDVTGPARPELYRQEVDYVRGHAGIVVTGANETTHLSVFSVGRITAVDQTLFRDDATYDGTADIAFIAIASANGAFGSLRTANTTYFGTRGLVGVYAPGVHFTGPVYVGDIEASESALPALRLGATGVIQINGGDLQQLNGRPVSVSGITRLEFVDGTDSHGRTQFAQPNRARLEENREDVTGRIVAAPAP